MNEPVDLVSGFVRLRVDFGYDGTDFNGWAKQPGLRTVEGSILDALKLVFDHDENSFGLVVAGRTDAGVHARNSVLHLDLTPAQIKRLGRYSSPSMFEGAIRDRLNNILDDDIRVCSVTVAPEGFDARFAAIHRRYRYRIADAVSVKDPVEARHTLWTRKPLDLLEMQAAALELYGLNDFAAFCKPRPFATTIRNLRQVTVRRRTDENQVIEVELLADAFCHNMVRSIVGALIAVGEGRADRQVIASKLASGSREGSFKVVSPRGLTLMEIGYPEPALMAQQVENAKALRSIDDEVED